MDFEIYKRKLLEEDERNRLSELQTKYNGIKTPDYANMSLRDELQTRFDLDELNNLQQKYGVQQTSALKSQITACRFCRKGKPVDRLVYGRQYYTGFIYQKTNRVQTG